MGEEIFQWRKINGLNINKIELMRDDLCRQSFFLLATFIFCNITAEVKNMSMFYIILKLFFPHFDIFNSNFAPTISLL